MTYRMAIELYICYGIQSVLKITIGSWSGIYTKQALTIYLELFVKENIRDILIVTVLVRKCS